MNISDETYNAIVAFKEREGLAPTIRELGKELGLSSTDSVRERLLTLEREGRIKRRAGSPRGIILLEPV